jgi:GNAT superfamily N-acetyltransferase
VLSDLALRSKGHWGYDTEFLEACRAELTFTPADVTARRVTVAEVHGRVVGMYALAGEAPVAELADVFVEPAHIGREVGKQLWRHAVDTAAGLGITRLTIDADPNALPFYLAMGAVRAGTVPSGSIPGRELPRLIYDTLET